MRCFIPSLKGVRMDLELVVQRWSRECVAAGHREIGFPTQARGKLTHQVREVARAKGQTEDEEGSRNRRCSLGEKNEDRRRIGKLGLSRKHTHAGRAATAQGTGASSSARWGEGGQKKRYPLPGPPKPLGIEESGADRLGRSGTRGTGTWLDPRDPTSCSLGPQLAPLASHGSVLLHLGRKDT